MPHAHDWPLLREYNSVAGGGPINVMVLSNNASLTDMGVVNTHAQKQDDKAKFIQPHGTSVRIFLHATEPLSVQTTFLSYSK